MASDVFGIVGTLQSGMFSVREVVAEGGFAVVYRAEHQGFRADVALKCLKVPGTLDEGARETFLEKFREEGELLFRLSAAIPAVVRPLHFGIIDSEKSSFVPFMALEWLTGQTLDRLIQGRHEQGKPPVGLERAVRLLGPVARALERAHRFPSERGVVSILHRDLKPENVFVAEVQAEEQVKILDFGIGKVKSAATQIVGRVSHEAEAFSAFTPAYGAPEQWLPKRFGQTGTWTDVWGFALTVLEAATGECPMQGDAAAIMGTALDERERPTPSGLGLAVPAAVDRAFARALAVDPRHRYHDVGEFWDELERLVGGATPRLDRVPSPLESTPPPGALVPELDLSPRARRAPVGAHAATVASPRARAEPAALAGEGRGAARSEPRTSDLFQRGSSWEQAGNRSSTSGLSPDSGLMLGAISVAPGARAAAAPRRRLAQKPRRETLAGDQVSTAIWSRLEGPLKLLGLAAAIAAADFLYFRSSGEPFRLGPLRAVWIAGPIAVLAIARLVKGLIH